jgi:hypothetical protein
MDWTKYQRLRYYLRIFSLENQLDLKQIQALASDATDRDPQFRGELASAFSDSTFSWQAALDDPEIGEVFPGVTEEQAKEYARTMFLRFG